MNPRPLLHLEGAAVLILSVFAYHWSDGNWGLFALLFVVPDLSMIGYLANVRAGAAIYNAIHTYVGPCQGKIEMSYSQQSRNVLF